MFHEAIANKQQIWGHKHREMEGEQLGECPLHPAVFAPWHATSYPTCSCSAFMVLPQCHASHAALYATKIRSVSYQQLLPNWLMEAAVATHQASCHPAALLVMLQSFTASALFTTAQLTLSTPPQMPQLLTDTDSLRLVPIVATCSVIHVTHCTGKLRCTLIQGHQQEKGWTGAQRKSIAFRQGLDWELTGFQRGVQREINRELMRSQ